MVVSQRVVPANWLALAEQRSWGEGDETMRRFRRIISRTFVMCGTLAVWAACVVVFTGERATYSADESAEARPAADAAPATSSFPVLSPEEFGKRRAQLFQTLLKQTKMRLEVPDIQAGKRPTGIGLALYSTAMAEPDAKKRREMVSAVVKLNITTADRLFREATLAAEAGKPAEVVQADRMHAITQAMAASLGAITYLKDQEVAGEIAELYLWPHVEAAHERHNDYPSRDLVMKEIVSATNFAGRHEQWLAAATRWKEMAMARGDVGTSDAARFRMAQALDALKRYDEAIAVLHEISDTTGMRGAKVLIPDLEKKKAAAKSQQPEPKGQHEPAK
jgi:hypothetical protein